MPPLTAVTPIVVVMVLLLGYCYYDLWRAEVQYLPKWVWALIILASLPVGAITYLAMGRKRT